MIRPENINNIKINHGLIRRFVRIRKHWGFQGIVRFFARAPWLHDHVLDALFGFRTPIKRCRLHACKPRGGPPPFMDRVVIVEKVPPR